MRNTLLVSQMRREGNTLPFNQMSGKTFEEFCVRIAAREYDVCWAVGKNYNGISQYGIDIEGYTSVNKPILVVSCKCYEKFYQYQLQKCLDEFLDNWDSHWKNRGVRKFVIALTARPNDNLTNVITNNTDRFSDLGIDLEPWWPVKLTEKALSAPRQLILPFFDESVARAVGGNNVALNYRVFKNRRFDEVDEPEGRTVQAFCSVFAPLEFPLRQTLEICHRRSHAG